MHTGAGAVCGFGCRELHERQGLLEGEREESEEQGLGRECPCFHFSGW